ncbi:MAG: UvrB/UvrC motif-containing protein [Turicibacter sp.]|nr:UvrB/UvrC motif-containing protein [Turicibacter sp.]
MLCDKCNKNQATVHMKQIVNGSSAEMNLCQDCATALDSPISIEAIFNGLLGSYLSSERQKNQRNEDTCEACGMTTTEFKSSGGKLGCANCYNTFISNLKPILTNVQSGLRHEGKFPTKSGRIMFQEREVGRLRELMQKSIEEENFEEAARIRDEVRLLETAKNDEVSDIL